MKKASVTIVRCPDYRRESLDAAIERLQEFIGGFGGLVDANERVFVKINHLGNHGIETAINTHPEVVAGIARSLMPVTSNVMVGDGLDTPDLAPFGTSGYREMCEKGHIDLINLCRKGYSWATIPGFHALERVPIGGAAAEADFVISAPKLKTHMLTLMTCGVKNNYGYLPHEMRVLLHRKHISPTDFAGAVVDVYAACKPGLVVVDAIDALEGNGPSTGGKPRHLGLLMAGTDAVAVDAVASAIMGIDPMDVATTRLAHERGLGVGELSDIEVRGCSIEEVRCGDFEMPPNHARMTRIIDRMPRPIMRVMSKVLATTRQWPKVRTDKCTGCGMCVKHCPQDTIEIERGKARINYDECISCFCCLEFCPANAMKPGRSAAANVVAGGLHVASRTVRGLGKIFRRR